MFNGKWEAKQGNKLPGQATLTNGIPGTHVGNTILQYPPGFSNEDFLAGSSVERNLIGLASSGSTTACSIPRQSNPHNGNSLLGLSGQGNSCGVFNEQKSVEPVSTRHQFDNQFHHRNLLSETRPNFNANTSRNEVEKVGIASYNLVSQMQPNPSVKMMPVSQTHKQTNNVFSQPEAHKSLPSLESYITDAENSLDGSNLQELIKFLSTTHGLPLKMLMEMGTSEYSRLVEILQQASVQPNKLPDGLDGRGYSLKEYSGGTIQSGSYSKVGGSNTPPSVEVASLGFSVSTEKDAIDRTRADEHFGSLTNCIGDKSKIIDGCHGEDTNEVREMTVTLSTEKPMLALTEQESSNYSGNQEKVVGNGQKNDQTLGPLNIDEKKLPSEKAARIVAEKLWDGSLQLSSSVTLSAVAFFKSGEKLLGNNWPEQVEVKGKVRLEAFEKYVQDLPRSRNRGLMVISLCWKEGSSETGLTGMKEVAKGYKKSSRVGFAQLSSGIDLYICPRTDTIITILAKYGFFKGMAVIDDKQDSMIGCVVWRRNRSSNPVRNTSDGKSSPNSTQPQNSPSGSSIKQGAKKEPSPTKQGPKPSEHIQSAIVPSSADLESSKENEIASKNVVSAEGDHKACNSSSNHSSLQNPINSEPCNLVRKRPFEDDDLPEFDFGVSRPVNPVIPNNHGLASAKSQSLDNSRLTQIPSIVNQGNHPISESKTPVLEEKAIVLRNTSNGSFEHSSKRSKLFDEDDDDMPEWCPPVLHNQIPPQITKSNFNKLPSCPPRPPPIPPPPPADTRSVFSYQPFRPPMSGPTVISARAPPPPPLPTQRHPSPSVGLNSNHFLRHQPVHQTFPSPNGRRPRP